MRRRNGNRVGFAMFCILWTLIVVGAIALSASVAGRDAFNASRNRVYAQRARWKAIGCADRARASIDSALGIPNDRRAWRHLDEVTAGDASAVGSSCEIRLDAIGSRLNVNAASEEELAHMFAALGRSDALDLAAAIVDWRDGDDATSANGAEGNWYSSRDRELPRNAPFADVAEVSLVRGLETGDWTTVLATDGWRISLQNANAAVLAAIPGFGDEAVAMVLEERQRGNDIEDVTALASSLSRAARDSIVARFQEIGREVTLEPEGWMLRASSSAGYPAIRVTVESHLIRLSNRAFLTRQRILQ